MNDFKYNKNTMNIKFSHDIYLLYANFFSFLHIFSSPKHVHLRIVQIRASVTFIRIQIQLGCFLAKKFQCILIYGMTSYNNILATQKHIFSPSILLKFASFEIVMHVIEDHNV